MPTGFSTTEIKPTVSHLMDTFEKLYFPYNQTLSIVVFSQAIDATYAQVLPKFFMMEVANGSELQQEVLTGAKVLQSLHQFMYGNRAYPLDGTLTGIQGKKFTELPHKTKRKFRETVITIELFVMFSGNNGKEQDFREAVKTSCKLN